VRIIIGCLGALLVALPGTCGGSSHASAAGPFVGEWSGHTRHLTVTRDGHGRELVSDGCCDLVLLLRFRVLKVRGTPARAFATFKVTSAQVNNNDFAAIHRRPPRVDQVGTLRLEHGIVTDELTEVTFCGDKAARAGTCGL